MKTCMGLFSGGRKGGALYSYPSSKTGTAPGVGQIDSDETTTDRVITILR